MGLWYPTPAQPHSRTLAGLHKGGGLATGTHWTALRPMGGTCPPEANLPQGKDGSPRRCVRLREGASRLREPNAGGDWSDRQAPEEPRRASYALPVQGKAYPQPVRQDLRKLGMAGGSGSGPRTWDTFAQRIATHLADKPRAHNFQQLRKKKKFFCLLALVWPSWPSGPVRRPGDAPGRPPRPRRGRRL